MRIHTVELGDTIWKIARKYSTHAAKIIEHNALKDPDRLIVGQKLMIFNPTRTYTVKGGDTLDKIAMRFGEKKERLIMDNPALLGGERIYPGQILAIRYDTPIYGTGSAAGYLYKGCTRERLCAALPYLDYVLISGAVYDKGKIRLTSSPSAEMKIIKSSGKIPILRLCFSGELDRLYSNSGEFYKSLIEISERDGYRGICLALPSCEKGERANALLMDLKRELMCRDMLLFSELDGNAYPENTREISEISDTVILNYQKGQMEKMPSFSCGEKKILEKYAAEAECQKTLLDISSFAYCEGREVEMSEALRLALKSGAEIKYDEDTMMCSFPYKSYKAGNCAMLDIVFEAPENIKAKLDLVGELGYMGISFDISRVPTEYLMLYHTSFHSPCNIGTKIKLS